MTGPRECVEIRFTHVFDHDIGVCALGFDVLFMHRLNDGVELQRHGFRRAGALADIAGHAPREPRLLAGIDKGRARSSVRAISGLASR